MTTSKEEIACLLNSWSGMREREFGTHKNSVCELLEELLNDISCLEQEAGANAFEDAATNPIHLAAISSMQDRLNASERELQTAQAKLEGGREALELAQWEKRNDAKWAKTLEGERGEARGYVKDLLRISDSVHRWE